MTERETETETETETERQRERETERQRQTDRQTDTKRNHATIPSVSAEQHGPILKDTLNSQCI